MVLGIAPPGGLIPEDWWPQIDEAVEAGFCVVNGLHDLVGPRYPHLKQGQWIWDIRLEPPGLEVAAARALGHKGRRVLMIGTDMAIGKMTAGLEIDRVAKARGIRSEFVATGQIGITLTGRGIPLDAIRIDFASGAVEREVLACGEAELIVVEGQGSLIHPGSSANLPLLRGSCPTHLILCHKAGLTHLQRLPEIEIPPLRKFTEMYEALASACGAFPKPVLCAGALNTSGLSDEEAHAAIGHFAKELGVPCTDPVRFGADVLVDALIGP